MLTEACIACGFPEYAHNVMDVFFARSGHQKGSNEKPIISIQADTKKSFGSYENLIVTFDELKEIVNDGHTTYSDWRAALSSVYAIYLIVEQESGHQYVGSAYNTTDGLWGRWSCYIATGGHGGNKKMVEVSAPTSLSVRTGWI